MSMIWRRSPRRWAWNGIVACAGTVASGAATLPSPIAARIRPSPAPVVRFLRPPA